MQKKIKMSNTVDYLEQLENEAIYILRETAAQFENQLCFSRVVKIPSFWYIWL
jgi:3'-phosphoadenosine 5'-phosphosulfate sulfotransferase (PAPS reductase)/FAD synthetase